MADTTEAKPWFEEIAMPALLRHGRTTYGAAMRAALTKAGYTDIPKNGLYVIGGLALENRDIPISQLIQELGISQQAAGYLVDALAKAGYLQLAKDPNDGSKFTATLTQRGQSAAEVQRIAGKAIEDDLIARVGAEDVLRTRRTLAVLIDIGACTGAHDDAE
jgi:DNA-binding MarR family transcriptional regulator